MGQAGAAQHSDSDGYSIQEITPRDPAIHSQLPVPIFFAHDLPAKQSKTLLHIGERKLDALVC